MQAVKMIAYILLIVGGLNWGLVGLLDLNLVTTIFGETGFLTMLVYDLVGLSALYVAYDYFMGGQTTVKKVSDKEM